MNFLENFNEFMQNLPFFVQIDNDFTGSSLTQLFRSKSKKIGDIQGYLNRQIQKNEANWQEYQDLAAQSESDLIALTTEKAKLQDQQEREHEAELEMAKNIQ